MPDPLPDFAAVPSPPRVSRALRWVVFLVMLGLACAAIWWIDRGVMMTNIHSGS